MESNSGGAGVTCPSFFVAYASHKRSYFCQKWRDLQAAARMVKAFTLTITGHLGLDSAQVTKGGIRMDEVDENLQSKKQKGFYFAGEILDIDGQCGGYNLQWAYASARTVAAAIDEMEAKRRGQV